MLEGVNGCRKWALKGCVSWNYLQVRWNVAHGQLGELSVKVWSIKRLVTCDASSKCRTYLSLSIVSANSQREIWLFQEEEEEEEEEECQVEAVILVVGTQNNMCYGKKYLYLPSLRKNTPHTFFLTIYIKLEKERIR